MFFRMKVLCMGSELIPSPKDEDRHVRYRFRPEVGPHTPSKKGDGWSDSFIFCAGEPGQFNLGKLYELDFELKEV